MYVVADCDLSQEFENDFKSVEDAMAKLTKKGLLAVEVRVAIFQFTFVCEFTSGNTVSGQLLPGHRRQELHERLGYSVLRGAQERRPSDQAQKL